MEKQVILQIQGMMCGHCEMHVQKALDAIDGVKTQQVSHQNHQAAVTLHKEVSDEQLKAAVENAGYEVLKIQR